jgi:hypothetical protein
MMFNHCGGESFWRDLYELADRIDGGGRLVKSGFDIVAAIEAS